MKKLLSITLTLALLLLTVASVTVSAASTERTLSKNQVTGVAMYLEKGQKVTITVTETSPYIETDKNTSFITGAYKPKGYNSKVGLSVNENSTGKNRLWKSFNLNSQNKNASRSYTFKAPKSDTYTFAISNRTPSPNRKNRVYQYPTYRLTVY